MFNNIIRLTQRVHQVVATANGQNKLLANILRKLIYMSVSDLAMHTDNALASSHTLTEYNTLLNIVTEEMDIGIHAFNNLLEDAQFEFRGFDIINIPPEKRTELDTFKSIIRNRYFDKTYTIHTYCTFGNCFLEIDFEGDTVMFDIHKQLSEEKFNWMFLVDKINEFVESESDCGDEQSVTQEMSQAAIVFHNNMMSWKICNRASGAMIMAKLVSRLMPYKDFFKGANDTKLEIWNDTMEGNWVLSDVINDVQGYEMYSGQLSHIACDVMDEFNANMIL
jgi:hypothetical protein